MTLNNEHGTPVRGPVGFYPDIRRIRRGTCIAIPGRDARSQELAYQDQSVTGRLDNVKNLSQILVGGSRSG
jgi:hypothetical protein